MPSVSSRALALDALRQWRKGQRFADAILAHSLPASGLSAPDRAFTTELFYGVLRNLMLLDFWIDSLRSGRVDHDSRDLLRFGLYQLFILGTPEHAAVFETVALAPRKSRPLINGVLRNAGRGKTNLLKLASEQDLGTRQSHPRFLVERWVNNFGQSETEALCEWDNQPALVYARINQLKISPGEFALRYPGLEGIGTRKNFVGLTTIPTEALAAGHCYIQDPSTAAACLLLDPQPGERVLDACAAPGGKTGYIAELMKNEGAILACDRDQDRLIMLRDNLDRLGVTIGDCRRQDWVRDSLPRDGDPVDRILIDAPCSNTGVTRRRADLRWRLRPEDFSRLPEQQLRIARATIPCLKVGGALVYSTCSLEPEENEEIARLLVHEFPGLKLEEETSVLPFRDGFDGAYAARFIRLS